MPPKGHPSNVFKNVSQTNWKNLKYAGNSFFTSVVWMLWKDHIIFKDFLRKESMEKWYKWRLGFTFKNEVTNFLIWYTKVLFNPLKHFQKIDVTDLQKLGYYWIFVLSINVNKSEIFKQNLFVWNPQMKMLGLVWYIL